MKQKFLLVSAAMLLLSVNMQAETWQLPTYATEAAVLDGSKEQYLYNVNTGTFLKGANDWQTRASAEKTGAKVKLTEETEGKYSIFNYVDKFSEFRRMFVDNASSMWVDNNNGANAKTWTIIKGEGNSFKIGNSAFPGQTLGVGALTMFAETTNTRLYMSGATEVAGGTFYDEWVCLSITVGDSLMNENLDEKIFVGHALEQGLATLKTKLPSVDLSNLDAICANKESETKDLKSAALNVLTRLNLVNSIETGKALSANASFAKAEALVAKQDATLDELKAAATLLASRLALGQAIANAKTKYGDKIDVAAEMAVFESDESTAEQITAANTSLSDKIKMAEVAILESTATGENPMDATAWIEGADLSTNKGWKGDAWTLNVGAGEIYNKNFDAYQDLTSMPNGVYKLNYTGFYRAGWDGNAFSYFKAGTNKNAIVYLISGTDTMTVKLASIFDGIKPNDKKDVNKETSVADESGTYYIPNSMNAAAKYFELGYYKGDGLFFEVADRTAKMGVKKTVHLEGDWTIFDGFELTYYGNGTSSYQKWLDEYVATLADFSGEDVLVTTTLLEEYNKVLAANKTATDKASVLTAISAIQAVYDQVVANNAAWKAYQEASNKADNLKGNDDIREEDKVALDELLTENQFVIILLELSTEELETLTEKINKACEEAIQNGLKEGSDFTSQLTNPAFTGSAAGWEGNPSFNSDCGERYGCDDFDVYQIVRNAPVGVYEISMQGFYRQNRDDDGNKIGGEAWNNYFNEDGTPKEVAPKVLAYVYLNDAETPLACVYRDTLLLADSTKLGLKTSDGYIMDKADTARWYPNDMKTAAIAFNQGMYSVSAFGLVAQKGDSMRIGIKGNLNPDGKKNSWAIFDNFKLTYQAYKADVIKVKFLEAVAAMDTTSKQGSEVIADTKAILAKADTVDQTNGKSMFKVLAEIYAQNGKIKASVELFGKLQDNLFTLNQAIKKASAGEAKTQASEFYTKIYNGLTNNTLTNKDAQDAIDQIPDMLGHLAIPGNYADATDDDPVDFTGVIKTPSFQNEDDENSIEGWQNTTGYNFGNDATQKGALAVEFFQKECHIYQDLKYLPAGVYGLSVRAFYRNGSADEDYKTFVNDSIGSVYLYSVGVDSICQPIVTLTSGAVEEEPSLGAAAKIKSFVDGAAEEDSLYIPNDMVGAVNFFDEDGEDKYLNEITILVGDDGKLRIGIDQTANPANGWFIMDNWQLWYYGTESKRTLTVENIADNTKTARVEIFNVNGQRMTAKQQGVNIVRRIDVNGNIKSYKIIIK